MSYITYTEVDWNVNTWDEQSCPKCGFPQITVLRTDADESETTKTITRYATIRNRDDEETGSIEFEEDVRATKSTKVQQCVCGFCLYKFTFTATKVK
jgi:hypothetical protein